jgi:CRP-like cAMP-binding protein
MKAAVDDRFKFLVQTPIFKTWGRYDLYRVAPMMKKIEINKGAVLFRKGDVTSQLFFLMEGRIDIVGGLEGAARGDIIVSIQKYEYYGESGILSHFKPEKSQRIYKEYCYAIAGAFSEVLVLTSDQYQIIDRDTILKMLDVFKAKKHWRADRSVDMRSEKMRLKKIKRELLDAQSQTAFSSIFGGEGEGVNGMVTMPMNHNPKHFRSAGTNSSGGGSGECFISAHDLFVDEDGNDILPNLNDIPKIIDSDLDPLLVTSTCRDLRSLKYAKGIIDTARRPVVPARHNSHAIVSENVGHFVMRQILSARERGREGREGGGTGRSTFSERAERRLAARTGKTVVVWQCTTDTTSTPTTATTL